ncbi:uncharacterized protein [Prorops nasuta]|uniref:uncharacterized protein n=1 Tax=Prorops nasuta TaxID=863751 RepID=UPI0034CE8DE5
MPKIIKNKSYFYRQVRKEVSEILNKTENKRNYLGYEGINVGIENREVIDDVNKCIAPCTSNQEVVNDFVDEQSDNSDSRSDNYQKSIAVEKSPLDLLKNWAVQCNISHVSLKGLLTILPKLTTNDLQNLPKDPRTFLGTIRDVTVLNIHPGHYYHMGIQHTLEEQYKLSKMKPHGIIEVAVNIDGLPLTKSSSSQLYPILIINLSLKSNKNVYLVGLYHGYEKPSDFNNFLREFVRESIELINNGIIIFGEKYLFRIKMFLFDAVAKCSILQIKGVTGYNSCTKCKQEGEYISDRVCFPDLNFSKRTHTDFINKADPDHHTGTTILIKIPGLNLIDDVPLDYMHMICLGVVKKCLVSTWCFGAPPHKLPTAQVNSISQKLEELSNYVPSEFPRRPRSLKESKRWKATEFRLFLLYTCPIVLKGVLSKEKYIHFITLHVAITLLISKKYYNIYIDYANDLLINFVSNTKILYGAHFLIHNIHNLLHLVDDVRRFGQLDNFSNFSSENYLQALKKMIRKDGDIIPQVVRRLNEYYLNSFNDGSYSLKECKFLQEYANGILADNCSSPQYKTVLFPNNFKLSLSIRDSCCIMNNSTIVNVKNFAFNSVLDEMVIIGHAYTESSDFYTEPCQSSLLDIRLVSNVGPLQYWPITSVANKGVRLPFGGQYVVFPLLHTTIL